MLTGCRFFFFFEFRMAQNSRSSKLTDKEDGCIFSLKLFSGWDFMIGHAETAENRKSAITLGFKEALLEEKEKEREKERLFYSWCL